MNLLPTARGGASSGCHGYIFSPARCHNVPGTESRMYGYLLALLLGMTDDMIRISTSRPTMLRVFVIYLITTRKNTKIRSVVGLPVEVQITGILNTQQPISLIVH